MFPFMQYTGKNCASGEFLSLIKCQCGGGVWQSYMCVHMGVGTSAGCQEISSILYCLKMVS